MKLLRLGMVVATVLLPFAPVRGDSPQAGTPTIDQKLKSIVVSVDFNNAKIDEALQALTLMSKQLDPTRKGVNFVIQPEAGTTAKSITLKLENVPLGETLRYVCELGGVHAKVDERLVTITPGAWNSPELIKRTFHVEPSFVEAVSSAGVIPSATIP